MQKKHKTEDFLFSTEQLRSNAKTFDIIGKKVTRHFINGLEFTQRGPSPLDPNFPDAEVVLSAVVDEIDASTGKKFNITRKQHVAKNVLADLDKRAAKREAMRFAHLATMVKIDKALSHYKIIHIACPHELSGMDGDMSHPDHHPLTKRDIKNLLMHARQNGNYMTRNSILIRLVQGIKGYTCPGPIMGHIAGLESMITGLFMSYHKERPTKQLVNQMYNLMNFGT